jgi:predicted ABC-type ATPase
MPNVIVIAGANGAGKSTLAPYLLRDMFGIVEYVNADTIAEGLSAFAPELAAFAAGRIMLGRLKEISQTGRDFAFETTLATRFYSGWLKQLQSKDYRFHLVYLWLENAELAIERVRARVRIGGHNVPQNIVRRRYEKSLQNLFNLYLPLADSWQIYDASEIMPQKIAFGDKIIGRKIVKQILWRKMQS